MAEHRDRHRPQARVDAHGDSRQDEERDREALPMFYEPAKNDHGLRFAPFKSCIVPRPIAWVSTVNAKGVINLSPFSQNNILGWDPPYVMFSAFTRFDGRRKDSVSNAEETGEFVFNMATYALRDAVVLTSAIEEAWRRRNGASRADARTIATGQSPRASPSAQSALSASTIKRQFCLPTLRPCTTPWSSAVSSGSTSMTRLSPPSGKLDMVKARPLARMGYLDYTSVTDVFELRPENTPAEQCDRHERRSCRVGLRA